MHFMLTWLLVRRLELRFNFKFFNKYHSQAFLLWYFFGNFKNSLPRKTLQIFRIPFIKSFKITRFSAFI